MLRIILAGVVSAGLIGSAAAADAPKEAEIPFAKFGGIRDWRADGDKALYVQGHNRRWYHADLMGSCTDLPFAEQIGFVVEPGGEFDRWSSILVRGRQCMVTSLKESGPPPPKKSSKDTAAPQSSPPQKKK